MLPGGEKASNFLDAAAGLRAAIDEGRLVAGDLVPTVSEIAARYGIARSTAQRAVSLLGSSCRQGPVEGLGCGWSWVTASEGCPDPDAEDGVGGLILGEERCEG